MKTLSTTRLIMRKWRNSDLQDLYEYAKVKGVGENAGWLSHTSIEVSEKVLQDFIINDEVYALEYKANNKVIGSLGIHPKGYLDGYKQKEIGYVLSKDYWGLGLTAEAVKEVIKYCFEELDIDIIWCCHYDFNKQSQRVIEKSGFQFYQNVIREVKKLGKTYNSSLYWYPKELYFKK